MSGGKQFQLLWDFLSVSAKNNEIDASTIKIPSIAPRIGADYRYLLTIAANNTLENRNNPGSRAFC